MTKLVGGLSLLLSLSFLVLGACISFMVSPIDAGLVAARARQADALADAEAARAAEAWARAQEAQARALAVRRGLDQLTAGYQLLALGLPVVMLAGLVGLVAVAVWWAWSRARVSAFYPKSGVHPVLVVAQPGGGLAVIDSGRSLGGVSMLAGGDVRQPLAGSEQAHAVLAAQSLAASVLAGLGGSDVARASVLAGASHAVSDALASLPALSTTSTGAPSVVFSSGGDMRVIKRNTPVPAPDSVKRGHMAEFLKRGAVVGFGRREFAGFTFSDGERLSQAGWSRLNQAARAAGVLDDSGLRGGSLAEALSALGLDEFAEVSNE